MFVSLTRVCVVFVVYVVKEVTSFPGLGQLMGVARRRNERSSSTDLVSCSQTQPLCYATGKGLVDLLYISSSSVFTEFW